MTSRKHVSRREFLKLAGLSMSATVISACAGQNPAPPTVVSEIATATPNPTAPATAQPTTAATTVSATSVASKPSAVDGVSGLTGPIPYPEGGSMAGMRPPKLFKLDDVLTYQRRDSYSEPDYIARLVQEGKLPPVEQRLPETPQVILSTFFADGAGDYGGVMRDVWASPIEGWNWAAGAGQGSVSIESLVQESLVVTGPMWLLTDTSAPLPNLAMNWEWSGDGKQLTMALVKGVKWSDGQPFTADDVLFTWEDIILDPNVVKAPTKRSAWRIDDQDITLEKVDDFTIRWTFPTEQPAYKLFDMNERNWAIAPAHVLRSLHPKYNGTGDYAAFQNALPPNTLPVVTLGPWVPVANRDENQIILRRNPYYWKIDDRGKQLPYLNEIIFERGDTIGHTQKVMQGAADHVNVKNPATYAEVTATAQQPEAPFRLEWGTELLGFSLLVNQSATFGVGSERDQAFRELFRNVKFRHALTQSIDRDRIAGSIAAGTFFRAWPGGLYPGSQFFSREATIYYPYAPETSKQLLKDIGFSEASGDGILLWSDGPLKGQPLAFTVTVANEAEGTDTMAEQLAAFFKQIGVQINLQSVSNADRDAQVNSGVWDAHIKRMNQEYAVPHVRYLELAPLTRETPEWNRTTEGAEQTLQSFEKDMNTLVKQFAREPDPYKQIGLMKAYQRLHTQNIYTIGLVVGRYVNSISKRIQNLPIGAPAFYYQWDYNNFFPEQLWIAAKDRDQVAEALPNTIPEYGQA